MRKSHVLVSVALGICLFSSCAYDTKKKRLDVEPAPGAGIRSAVDDVKDQRQAKTAKAQSSITVNCVVFYGKETLGNPAACEKILFRLIDENEHETARGFPNREGTVQFATLSGKSYRIEPAEAIKWKMIQIPEGKVRAGESVRVLLRQ